MNAQLRAVLLLVPYGLMTLLGTPGLDNTSKTLLSTPKQIERWSKLYWPPGVRAAAVFMDLQRNVRRPLLGWLSPLQRPLRIEQSWTLYGDGPDKVRKMEIRVDDVLVHRSGDDENAWLEPALRNRRLRPVTDTAAEHKTRNRIGLARFITERAREDFPMSTHVSIEFLEGPFPGSDIEAQRAILMTAPDWKPVDVDR